MKSLHSIAKFSIRPAAMEFLCGLFQWRIKFANGIGH